MDTTPLSASTSTFCPFSNFSMSILSTVGISLIILPTATTGSVSLLIIAAGLKPNISLAKDAGCKIGKTGRIIVKRKSETSIKNIYAIGDCTEFYDIITKKPVPIGLGSIAVRQGIAAGINAAGGSYLLPDGVLQTCTSEFFGIEIASVGSNVEAYSTISGKYNGLSLPHYFPGGKPISIKVFIDEIPKLTILLDEVHYKDTVHCLLPCQLLE